MFSFGCGMITHSRWGLMRDWEIRLTLGSLIKLGHAEGLGCAGELLQLHVVCICRVFVSAVFTQSGGGSCFGGFGCANFCWLCILYRWDVIVLMLWRHIKLSFWWVRLVWDRWDWVPHPGNAIIDMLFEVLVHDKTILILVWLEYFDAIIVVFIIFGGALVKRWAVRISVIKWHVSFWLR